LIAASIIWVGVQNWRAQAGGRWPISFVFGLVLVAGKSSATLTST
jgi:hypothetical protein